MRSILSLAFVLSAFSAQALDSYICQDPMQVATAKIYEFVAADKFTFRFLTYLEIDTEVIYKSRFAGKYLSPDKVLVDEFVVSGFSGGVLLEHEGQELILDCQLL